MEGGKIVFVGSRKELPEEPDIQAGHYAGHYLVPGMIDLQVNGVGGADAATADVESIGEMSKALARFGVTGFLPTLITDEKKTLIARLEKLSETLTQSLPASQALGIHLEGPFLNPEKRGAHRQDCIQLPSRETLDDFLQAGAGRIKMLTLAPEMDGAISLIERARYEVPIVALGHSQADYETAATALGAGANFGTHIFNAMPALHHRRPGLVGALLEDARASVGVIADGIHLHPAVVGLVYRCKGADQVVLVSDSMSAAGMPDGNYRLGNLEVQVRDGICRLEDGRLAGSTLTLDGAVRNLSKWYGQTFGFDLHSILASATKMPARLLGQSGKGRIEVGADADLVLLNKQLEVTRTWVGGQCVYERSPAGSQSHRDPET